MNDSPRPFWQWILLAVIPGLVSDVLSGLFVLADGTAGADALAGLSMLGMLAALILMVPYLIVLSKHYVESRGPTYSGSRSGFVIGFCFVNLFLWGGGCVVAISQLNFH